MQRSFASSNGVRLILCLCMVSIGLLLSGCPGGDDSAVAQGAPTDVSGVTQAWDKKLPSGSRFTVLATFNNQAVRDNETGLVWEQAPSFINTWEQARVHCAQKVVGGRMGWRLPSIEELTSLTDASVPLPGPFITPGIFSNVDLTANYWSASATAGFTNLAWVNNFRQPGLVGNTDRTGQHQGWCVRGDGPLSEY